MQLVVRSARVILPTGEQPAALHIRDGRIAAIRPFEDWPAAVPCIDAGELVVMPGVVDSHVHINEPGRTEWEGFATATRAAAAGGVTTLIDMPLNSIPATTTAAALAIKQQAAEGQCHVDVGFWGGVVPDNAGVLEGLARAGVFGFKAFLASSGVPELQHVSMKDLERAAPHLRALGLPLLVHAELPSELREPAGDARQYATWLESRPPAAETAAIDRLIEFAEHSGVHVHIVHLATPAALPSIAAARGRGVTVTVETCPHYLTFAAEDIPDGATAFKCAPPIRTRSDREQLWRALAHGSIDLVATDHSPAPPSLKETGSGDFVRAWGGIASLQLGLAAVWTGASARGLSLEHLASWMCAEPAALAGLTGTKGMLAAGADADLAIWDPDASTVVDQTRLYHRHPLTPYDGLTLRGQVTTTILRGQIVFDRETGMRGSPAGRLLSGGVRS